MTKKILYYSVLGDIPTKKVRAVTIEVISESRCIDKKSAGDVKVVYPKELKKIYEFFGHEEHKEN